MSSKNRRLLLWMFFVAVFTQVQAQPGTAFWNDIVAFRKADSLYAPAARQILFVGSSSFTMWKDVQSYFPSHPIINRGFGGSSLPDVIRYAEDVIFKYNPRQIVIYCGENDLGASDTVSAATVTERFKTLFSMIRNRLPRVPIVFVSLKPSPSRQHLMPKMLEANIAIRQFLKKKKKTTFIDVYHSMLTDDGQPRPDIFLGDKLHMNAQGYAIWQKLIEPHLLK